jgi:2-oxoglutarate ferredoxin oxidoreductase subunit gamma
MAGKKYEIRVTGFGGQGVILCGYIIGNAAALFDKKFSVMTQDFGPEARGSACSAAVIIAPDSVEYPYITRTNVLLALSQDAFKKYIGEAEDDAMILYDSDLVKPEAFVKKTQKLFPIPATRIAEELGKKIVLNIVVMGFFAAVVPYLSTRAMRKAVLASIPKGTEEFNMKAFDEGFDYGVKLKRRNAKPAPRASAGAK